MKIIFLDRDGVINKNRSDYVKSWSEFQFLPRSLDAIQLLTANEYHIIVVTNQSVINRKFVTEDRLRHIHQEMTAMVTGHGGNIDAIYHCPHVPDDGCDCRKPQPGLIYRAQADFGLDLAATCMIGDSFKDIQCARTAGCGTVALVRTGHGKETETRCRETDTKVDLVANDLMEAAQWLVGGNN